MATQEYHTGDYWPLRWEHVDEDGDPPEHFADTDYYIQITTASDRDTVLTKVTLTKIQEDGLYTGELYGIVDAEETEEYEAGQHLFFVRAVFPQNDAPGTDPFTLTVQPFTVEIAPDWRT